MDSILRDGGYFQVYLWQLDNQKQAVDLPIFSPSFFSALWVHYIRKCETIGE